MHRIGLWWRRLGTASRLRTSSRVPWNWRQASTGSGGWSPSLMSSQVLWLRKLYKLYKCKLPPNFGIHNFTKHMFFSLETFLAQQKLQLLLWPLELGQDDSAQCCTSSFNDKYITALPITLILTEFHTCPQIGLADFYDSKKDCPIWIAFGNELLLIRPADFFGSPEKKRRKPRKTVGRSQVWPRVLFDLKRSSEPWTVKLMNSTKWCA